MTVRVLRSGRHRQMPWRNGGGTTLEVARCPEHGDDFDWRISIAEVSAGGPFSSLPGIDRVILLVEGPGMKLTIDGTEHALQYAEPLAFSGDASVTCAVSAPTRDLNVMTRRGSAAATVEVLRPAGGHTLEPNGADLLAVVCVAATARAATAADGTAFLEPLDAAVFSGAEPVWTTGPGQLAAVRIYTSSLPRAVEAQQRVGD